MKSNYVTVGDIDFEVVYELSEYIPETFDSPSEGGVLYIEKIFIDSFNVTDILSQSAISDIEEAILKNECED